MGRRRGRWKEKVWQWWRRKRRVFEVVVDAGRVSLRDNMKIETRIWDGTHMVEHSVIHESFHL